jgi:two-component system, chemotaxis family, sensor kinase CheA
MARTDALKATFFEECEDLIARMGEGLGRMADPAESHDIELVHDIFRAVHSIKGGAGAFGMTSLVSFAHAFETVLDLMRSKKLANGPKVIPTLFRAFDVLSDMVASARDGGPDPAQLQALQMDLDRLADCSPADHAQTADEDYSFDFQPIQIDILPSTGSQASAEGGEKRFRISLGPTGDLYAKGHEPAAFLRSLSMLGKMHVEADIGSVTSLQELDLAQPHLLWKVELQTTAEKDEIEAIFDFIDDMAVISVNEMHDTNPVQNESSNSTPVLVQRETEVQDSLHQIDTAKEPSAAILPFSTTIRVNLDRVDRLINQIGELVIMEAMLSQVVSSAGLRDDTDITSSLDGIKQLAANIQESVMSIRAQPIKPVFQRMQRIVREASDLTGKEVHLHMLGEATEVDKTVIERLVDPLTHMIRNSVDHGIETPNERQAAGKPTTGRITLSAAHRSGRVIIEVADDGGGIDRNRVRDAAEAKGLIAPGAVLAPTDIDNLLFLPGFSSKQEVSALSGRGVGLDVVRREIQSLGGRVTIQSTPGVGTTFTIALPLTLAVLEGMLISVGNETMVIPLSAIIETIRPTPSQLHLVGHTGRLVANRGELVPIIDLAESFGFSEGNSSSMGVLIMVECDSGCRAALAADHIHDQRQVVIKSLENNYGSVAGISAATILGDGKIALIIDPEEIVHGAATDSASRSYAAQG